MVSYYFWIFWIFFPNASCSKLCVSTNFMILEAMDQKLWVLEVFRKSLGRAGMCWSQSARVDHLRKKWRAREKKNSKKTRQSGLSKRRPTDARQPRVDTWTGLDCRFFYKKNYFLEVWEMGQGFWVNGCTTPPFFEACPYTWKC
jgi:hypothetical protein